MDIVIENWVIPITQFSITFPIRDCSGVVQHAWSWDTKTTKTTTMMVVVGSIPWQMVKHLVLPF